MRLTERHYFWWTFLLVLITVLFSEVLKKLCKHNSSVICLLCQLFGSFPINAYICIITNRWRKILLLVIWKIHYVRVINFYKVFHIFALYTYIYLFNTSEFEKNSTIELFWTESTNIFYFLSWVKLKFFSLGDWLQVNYVALSKQCQIKKYIRVETYKYVILLQCPSIMLTRIVHSDGLIHYHVGC